MDQWETLFISAPLALYSVCSIKLCDIIEIKTSYNKSVDADEYLIKLGAPAFIMKLMKNVEVTLKIGKSILQTCF